MNGLKIEGWKPDGNSSNQVWRHSGRSRNLFEIIKYHGPLFHRWLPDGEKDAIALETGDPNALLKVWFERRGFIERDFIRFDYKRKEVDPEIIPTQGMLEGGPLLGRLEIRALAEEELDAVRNNRMGDDSYITLGKRIAKKLLYPPLFKFLAILRANYGQYWFENLEPWDSRTESLGAYFGGRLQVDWSLDAGATWTPFQPNEPMHLMQAEEKDYSAYITQADWSDLRQAMSTGYDPSLAAISLARAHELQDRGMIRHAFIEAVTALELALNEFMRKKIPKESTLQKDTTLFSNLPLRAQITCVGAMCDKVSYSELESAVSAIDMRNKIVHEGWEPNDAALTALKSLFTITAAFIFGPRFHFPTADPGNVMYSAWAKRN